MNNKSKSINNKERLNPDYTYNGYELGEYKIGKCSQNSWAVVVQL